MKNRLLVSLFGAATALMLLQGCASSAKAPDAPAAPVAKQQAAATTEDDAAKLDAEIAEAARGYTRVNRDGVTMFCRRERPSGSNIATSVCVTEAELRARVEATRKFNQDTMQQGRRCTQGPACQTS
ncbi:MAG TPA: hypothetical protein VM146_11695 [Steroidobacteraceae bacterium]|nr:hypothetical protein [Steroidobacteraceae bacterium]